jgi:hypothetical protein
MKDRPVCCTLSTASDIPQRVPFKLLRQASIAVLGTIDSQRATIAIACSVVIDAEWISSGMVEDLREPECLKI